MTANDPSQPLNVRICPVQGCYIFTPHTHFGPSVTIGANADPASLTEPAVAGTTVVISAATHTLDALAIRRRLDRRVWGTPRPFGDGWCFDTLAADRRIIVSPFALDGVEWIHASVSRRDAIATHQDLVELHAAVWPDGHAYQVFVPPAEHININEFVLHLWGRMDGARVLPDFAVLRSI